MIKSKMERLVTQMSDEILDSLTISKEIKVYYKGRVVLDSKIVKILEEVERKGSLLAACKSQGLSYSGVWKRINEIEEVLGQKILVTQRGGTGGGWASLTDFGKSLLIKYYELIEGHSLTTKDFLIYSGYDPLFESYIRGKGKVKANWVGSLGGLSFLMMGVADMAGVSLFDPDTGKFTVPFIERFYLSDKVVVIRGYQREVGFVYKKGIKVRSIRDIIDNNFKFINRIRGSGTRILIDRLIRESALAQGECCSPYLKIRGYNQEVKTHVGVAKKIVKGDADVGISLRYIADLYGLEFTPITWEIFDFVVNKDSLRKPFVKKFINFLVNESLNKPKSGYKRLKETGRIIYP